MSMNIQMDSKYGLNEALKICLIDLNIYELDNMSANLSYLYSVSKIQFLT